VIEIREPAYHVDLPGEWEAEAGGEESAACFYRADSNARLTVTLLGVRPMFAIADQHRLLDDYMTHRANFETGPVPQLEQTEPESDVIDGTFVGTWSAITIEHDRRIKHFVVLTNGLLVDFTYEEKNTPEAEFQANADRIFRTARVFAEQPADSASADEPEGDEE
jgi:hypothetical protein